MALSIGVEYNFENWRTCLMEHGRTLELRSFLDSESAFGYLQYICALYPEPTITLSVGYDLPLTRLNQLTEQQRQAMDHLPQRNEIQEILLAINSLSLDSYCLPAIRYLSSVPIYRKLKYENTGTTDGLCIIATLLYRMREREMSWSEMEFFYVELGQRGNRIVVIENGRIVNSLCNAESASKCHTEQRDAAGLFRDELEAKQAFEQAFWEELTQELAGLMAIHHLEDVIIRGQHQDRFAEHFGDTYQVYIFPQDEPDTEEYEGAIGAAIIAEGLRYAGIAAEVVEQLQICSAV